MAGYDHDHTYDLDVRSKLKLILKLVSTVAPLINHPPHPTPALGPEECGNEPATYHYEKQSAFECAETSSGGGFACAVK